MKLNMPTPLQQEHEAPAMNTPAFFDQAPSIVMHDALAQTLGAAQEGRIEFRYLDAVKLAGHSCPTVAGAWRLTPEHFSRLLHELAATGLLQVKGREITVSDVQRLAASGRLH